MPESRSCRTDSLSRSSSPCPHSPLPTQLQKGFKLTINNLIELKKILKRNREQW